MKKLSIILCLILSALCVNTTYADVIASPASITMPRGTLTVKTVTFTAREDGAAQAISNIAYFMHGATVLGTIHTYLSITLTGTGTRIGSVSEGITVPYSVMKKAEELNANQIQYIRKFDIVGAGTSRDGIVTITFTSAAAADLSLNGIRLYFDNNKAEVTVKRKDPALKAYADISFTGSGFLQGYWRVDNRILSHVNRHLTYGKALTISTPEIPSLPTFSEGTHVVQFIITQPDQGITLPKAIYYVIPDKTFKMHAIKLMAPNNRGIVNYGTVAFTWQDSEPATVYLVEFMEYGQDKAIVSAYAVQPSYTLPKPILKTYFTSGERYLWRVKSFDAENNVIGKSLSREFKFQQLSAEE